MEDIKEILKDNEINLEDLEEVEEIIAPASGCGCGGAC